MSQDKIEKFLQEALELAEDARIGKLVIEAARTGKVPESPPLPIDDNEAAYWAELRRLCLIILNRYWNDFRQPLEVWHGIDLVIKEIWSMVEEGKREGDAKLYWKWGEPVSVSIKVTIKRRFNELQSKAFYAKFGDLPKAIQWMSKGKSWYMSNPHFLPKEVKEAMEAAYADRLYGKVSRDER